MDVARYQKLKLILTEAGGYQGADRTAYLDGACGPDEALREEVDELLRTLSDPTVRVSGPVPAPAVAGRQIGPFELVECIGEGGMGSVWRAHQMKPVRRDVALKLLRAGLDSPEAVARFEAERQALALMDHDCIAKVYEAGATEYGYPFFAMEFVRGEPITAHCDRHRLGIRERVELMRRVCGGVQHAHQKAIIHRDLKPSNILVTGEGPAAVPKIIDFGVAKAIGAQLTDRAMVTHLGQVLGTPEYMAPEQFEVSAMGVDTRADVYALGVLLYELLAGALPFESKRLRADGWESIRRILREEEPPSPSDRFTSLDPESASIVAARRRSEPSVLLGRLRGDLDWIVMKAMDKSPSRRYGTAAELADDLRRFLANEAVLARPPSTSYRLSKFLRRHRTAVSVGAVIASFLVAFGAMMTVQAARIARERDRAQVEARRAEAVSGYLLELFESSDPTGQQFSEEDLASSRKILMRGLERANSLNDQPEAQAKLLGGIGQVLLNLGLPEESHVVLERAVVVGEQFRDDDMTMSLMSLGRAETEMGHFDDAEPRLLAAVALSDSLHPEPHGDRATARRWLAELRRAERRFDDAEKLLREAVDMQRVVTGTEHIDYASTISALAHVLRSKGRPEEALPLTQQAHDIQKRMLGPRHGDVATSTLNLAGLLREMKRPAEAEPLYREAIALNVDFYGERSSHTAIVYNNYGVFLRGEGKFQEAREILEKAVAIGADAIGPESPMVARALANLGRACVGAGDPAAAEKHFRRALQIQQPLLPADDSSLASLRADLGESLAAQGKPVPAEESPK